MPSHLLHQCCLIVSVYSMLCQCLLLSECTMLPLSVLSQSLLSRYMLSANSVPSHRFLFSVQCLFSAISKTTFLCSVIIQCHLIDCFFLFSAYSVPSQKLIFPDPFLFSVISQTAFPCSGFIPVFPVQCYFSAISKTALPCSVLIQCHLKGGFALFSDCSVPAP